MKFLNWVKALDSYNRLGLREPEEVVLPKDMGDWEPKDMYPSIGEIDALGNRLDYAREALAKTKTGTWAHTYWTNLTNDLVRRWQRLMIETKIGVHRAFVSEAIPIRQDWIEYEGPVAGSFSLLTWVEDRLERTHVDEGIEKSWNRAKQEELERARQGLV